MALNEGLTIRRDHLDLGLIGITLGACLILVEPWPALRAIITPWFLFLLPGCAAIVLLKRELTSPVEFIVSSFLIGVSFILISRVLLSLLSRTISSNFLIAEVAIWTLSLLFAGYVWDTMHGPPRSITLERSDLYVILLVAVLYAWMSVFVLRANYTPTPDELRYLLQARNLNLAATLPLADPDKVWPVAFALSRPLWFISLASYLLASADSPFSSQVVAVFFFVMLVLATYRVAKRLFGGEVGLSAAIITALSPSLLIWGSTVLLDVPFAVFLVLGYGYYLDSIHLKNGKLERMTLAPLASVLVCFLLASLIKVSDPILPVLIYAHFTYLIWKSKLPTKRLVLVVLLGLPALYLTLDGLYNFFTLIIPNARIHELIRPILPVSFFDRFLVLFHPSAGYKSIAAVSLGGILQGIYVAGLAPFLIIYPVLLMSIAGVIRMVNSIDDSTRVHAVFSLLIVGLVSFLASILLDAFEIPRNVIYIYPFIIIAAAVGLHFSVQKRIKEFILSATGMVALIIVVESSMLASGITLGVVPAPDQYKLSLFSLNFLAGVAILIWKVFESRGASASRVKREWRAAPWVAIGLICLVSFSQFSVFAQTSNYRSTSDFSGLSRWLDSHIRPGDIILTNGRSTVMSLANDTALRLIDQEKVQLLSIPNNFTALLQLPMSSDNDYDYLIVFEQGQYIDGGGSSNLPEFFMQSKQWANTLLDTTSYRIATLAVRVASTMSTIDISTVNSVGKQISGYYTTLLQNGAKLQSCFSPCSFMVNNGQTYQVAVTSYGNEKFSHWQNDGSTGLETVNVPGTSTAISVTAVYNP